MTQEQKELLLKDLCARLPYHPQCYCKWTEKAPNDTDGCVQELSTFVIDEIEIMDDPQFKCQICDVKPYLRPLSSMTEDEKYELYNIRPYFINSDNIVSGTQCNTFIQASECQDWLNSHYFDYHGLIEKGLALEALEGMYK